MKRRSFSYRTILLLLLTSTKIFAQNADTLSIYFDLNSYEITKQAKKELQSEFGESAKYDTLRLLINGYADFLGSETHNLELSGKRAVAVLTYLHETGIDERKIKICLGRGEIKRADSMLYNNGVVQDRRVEIIPVSIDLFRRVESNYYPPFNPDTVQLPISTTEVGSTFVFEHVYFLSSRHTPVDVSLPILDKLYRAMSINPQLKIKVEGHICCTRITTDENGNIKKREAIDLDVPLYVMEGERRKGPRYFRNGLSGSRAKYIYDYLLERGIDKSRVAYKGLGNTMPLIKDDIYDKRNRRIEIRILDK